MRIKLKKREKKDFRLYGT